MDKQIYIIRKKYLAEALGYLGFYYSRYKDQEGNYVYGFEDSDIFREAMEHITSYKKILSSHIK